MDRRLFQAAMTGDMQNLYQLLEENPLIFHTFALASAGNPLCIASAYGHIDFVKEIIRLKPDLTKEVDQDGFSPLHMASSNGHVEIVRELIRVDKKLCHLQGLDEKTPLHCAAIKGKVDVVSEMLLACPDCIEDVTNQRETALHLVIKSNQFGAIRVLVDWIRDMKKEDILNLKDEQGNTVLHLATWKKQRQVIELLIGQEAIASGLLEVNAINQSGLTALDVLLIFPSEAGDREIDELLRSAGAKRYRDLTHSNIPSSESPHNQTLLNCPTTQETNRQRPNDLVEYFKFKRGRDSPGEARSALLVIAVLVATATFQSGINPPEGVWQDSYIHDGKNGTDSGHTHYAGRSVMGSMNAVAFSLFMLFNSIGFAMSLHMINILTIKFPLQFELQICMISMFFTYNTAVINIAPDIVKPFVIAVTAILPTIIPLIAKWVRYYVKQLKDLSVDLIRRVIR